MPRHFSAKVRQDTGLTRHWLLQAGTDRPVLLSEASEVEIVPARRGVHLIRWSRDGDMVGETWHEDVDDAKAQAAEEYLVLEGDWEVVADGEATDQEAR